MSFIDDLYEKERKIEQSKKSQKKVVSKNHFFPKERNILKTVLPSIKNQIKKDFKKRHLSGFLWFQETYYDGPILNGGIDFMNKKKPKKFSQIDINGNRWRFNFPFKDRFKRKSECTISVYGEFLFDDFSQVFLNELKREIMELGVKSVNLEIIPQIEELAHIIRLDNDVIYKHYKARYYNGNKIKKALKISINW